MRRSKRHQKSTDRRPLILLVRDSRGATAVEYGLILALVVLTLMAAMIELAGVTTDMWGNVNTKVTNAR